jgi:hypothetical protein
LVPRSMLISQIVGVGIDSASLAVGDGVERPSMFERG